MDSFQMSPYRFSFLFFFWLIAPLWLPAADGGPGAQFEEDGETLTVSGARYRMTLDRKNGALRSVEDLTGKGTLLRGGESLWTIERHNMPAISSLIYRPEGPDKSDASDRSDRSDGRFFYKWTPESQQLKLLYAGTDADVTLICQAADESVDWRADIRMKRGVALQWNFPVDLTFEGKQVNTFYFPHNIGLGFTKEFFRPNTRSWKPVRLGPQGFDFVTSERLQMRPVQDDRVVLSPTEAGKQWLPGWYQTEMKKWRVIGNRCPLEKYDVCLVECEHGAWLTGYQLGGWGWLLRMGGRLGRGDFRPAFASVIATLSRLYDTPPSARGGAERGVPESLRGKAPSQWPSPPRRVGVLAFQPRLTPGARVEGGPLKWVEEMRKSPWVKERSLEIAAIGDLDTLFSVLKAPREWFAVVNPLGESFPVPGVDRWQETLRAVKEYARGGGVWWEAGGGYPFHQMLVPDPDVSLTAAAQDLFSDFAHLDSAAGRWSLYGIQPEDGIFVSPQITLGAAGPEGGRLGHFSHAFQVYISQGASWRSPLLRMTFGRQMRSDLTQYGAENKYTRGLEAKVKPDVLEKLKRAVLVKLSQPTLAEQVEVLDRLPAPALVHVSNYLRGGFDKQYPDHLPPNPKAGTAEELKRLIDRCHERGHLFMPYTNPTWWCIEPKGPTFEREGEAPLSRDLDGKLIPEAYGHTPNRGYTICGYHPAVRAANDVTRDRFTRQYPSDVLFEDQVGARRLRYDLNPAAPNPAAYLQGIHNIARVDCAYAPLATEDGHDRLINYETIFCGVSWPWLPNLPLRQRVLYEDMWPREAFRIEPLAIYLAHDKVLFTHHDLGGFILDRNDMVQSMAFGYGMSCSIGRAPAEDPATAQWLDCLSHIQRSVASRYAGQPLDAFEYVTRDVMKSRWGGLELIVNAGDSPYRLDGNTSVAGKGFSAKAPGLEAGIFTRFGGEDRDPKGWWLIREHSAEGRWNEWTFVGDRPGT